MFRLYRVIVYVTSLVHIYILIAYSYIQQNNYDLKSPINFMRSPQMSVACDKLCSFLDSQTIPQFGLHKSKIWEYPLNWGWTGGHVEQFHGKITKFIRNTIFFAHFRIISGFVSRGLTSDSIIFNVNLPNILVTILNEKVHQTLNNWFFFCQLNKKEIL